MMIFHHYILKLFGFPNIFLIFPNDIVPAFFRYKENLAGAKPQATAAALVALMLQKVCNFSYTF